MQEIAADLIKALKDEYATPLHVFDCTAYVLLPSNVQADKLTPKSELMVYLSVAPGYKANYLFMCFPNNVLFTIAQASFEEVQFPKWERPK